MVKVAASIFLGLAFFALLLFMSRSVMPNSGMYTFKRVFEKLNYMTKRSPTAKEDYEISLLNERMKEINYIYYSKDRNLLLSTTMRYSATAGKLTDIIISNNLSDQKSRIYKLFETDRNRLNILEVYYKGFEKKFIADAAYSLNQYQGMLKN